MTLVTEQPKDLPTTNALDAVEDPDAPNSAERAEIYLSGAHVCTLANPPAGRGRVTLMVELEVIEESVRFNDNDEEIPIRRCKRVGDMYRPGTARPLTKDEIAAQRAAAEAKAEADAAHDQPPLFEDDDPDSDDGEDEYVDADPDEDEVSNVVPFEGGPAFSDNGSDDGE